MPHRDTNGNESYEFVESDGSADGPYSDGEGAITDSAVVTVQTGDGMSDGGMDGGMDGGTDDGTNNSENESGDGSGPGFGPVAGLAGLGGLAGYAYRKLRADTEPAVPADDDLDEDDG
jgi:PGF-CTERM protein